MTPDKTRWAWISATVAGIGYLGPGPGTYASSAAAAVWIAWIALDPGMAAHPMLRGALTAAGVLAAMLVGVPAASIVEDEAGTQDPGFVVIDEVAGQWTALIGCAADWRHALLGLVLFRLFDIVKPWPARQLERLHGGWGIMLDDLAAGAWALILLLLVQHWW